jgi:hypothetical protein
MSGPQITIRVNPALKAQFDAYVEKLDIDASELAKLLIIRERNLQRLRTVGRKTKQQRRPKGTGIRLPTVTAHFGRRDQVENFAKYATSCGMSRSSAGAWLLQTELSERWLEKALHSE